MGNELYGIDVSKFNKLPSEYLEEESKKLKMYNYQKSLIQVDMITIKDAIKGTIYFKRLTSTPPQPDDVDEFEFDYWDAELIRLLAKVKLKGCHQDSIKRFVREFEEAYDFVKNSIDEDTIELFEFWREDGNLQEHANKRDLNHSLCHKRVKSLLTLIQRKMIENYELDCYYTEKTKGNWKTCSKCGEVKIANEYYFAKDRTGKDGFKSICKVCKAEIDKNK